MDDFDAIGDPSMRGRLDEYRLHHPRVEQPAQRLVDAHVARVPEEHACRRSLDVGEQLRIEGQHRGWGTASAGEVVGDFDLQEEQPAPERLALRVGAHASRTATRE